MGSMAELVHLDCQRKCPFESGQLAIDSRVPGAFLLALHYIALNAVGRYIHRAVNPEMGT